MKEKSAYLAASNCIQAMAYGRFIKPKKIDFIFTFIYFSGLFFEM